MVCLLSTPQWSVLGSPGLQSAVENFADDTIVLTWNSASPTGSATSVHYIVYYSSERSTLFDQPRFVTTETSVAIPKTIADLSQYFAVRAAQLGVSATIDNTNMVEVNDDLLSIPSSTSLRLTLGIADGYVAVDSTSGFPTNDGYLKVEDEVIYYSNLTTYMSGPAFQISSRDPFGCNTIVSHVADGYVQVELFKGFEEGNSVSFKGEDGCVFTLPEWVDKDAVGIRSVEDLGVGNAVTLSWRDAFVPSGFSPVYYNVYRSNSLGNLLSFIPYGIATDTEVTDPNLQPGDGYYYSVRASYQLSTLNFTNFTQLSDDFYAFPSSTQIDELDGYLTSDETGAFTVLSTEGYPDAGQLRIGSEILSYTSKTSTTFVISQRDIFELDRVEDYPNGTTVTFFRGIEDNNSTFFRTTPTWDASSVIRIYPPTPGDGYDGYQYLQDSDGYRNIQVDNITEDHTNFESENEDYESQDYCGVRNETFVPLYSGERCGTFHGGQKYRVIPGVNGGKPVPVGGGINVFEQATQREEFLLGLTGEPFVLLRRKWTGRTCPRLSLRHEHPHARCGMCFGTTFTGLYDRYVNERTLRPGEPNPNGFIQVRVEPYTDDLLLHGERGLTQESVDINAWTTSIPNIKDRDILIRFIVDNERNVLVEEFRYEVLSITRNKLLFGKDGAQKMRIKRLNKTEEIYKFVIPLI